MGWIVTNLHDGTQKNVFQSAETMVKLKARGTMRVDNSDFRKNICEFMRDFDLFTSENINKLANSRREIGLNGKGENFLSPIVDISDDKGEYLKIYDNAQEENPCTAYKVSKNNFPDDRKKLLKWVLSLVENQLSQEQMKNLIDMYENKYGTGGTNLIIYGAPGTGKSHWVEKSEDSQFKGTDITRVVFHPEYTYFDFVGQYRPCPVYDITTPRKFVTVDGKEFKVKNGGKGKFAEPFIDYCFVPGPFTDVLVNAWKNPRNKYTLLIEELNRADAPAVFGDVFQLLDRDKDGNSEYGLVPSAEWKAYLESKKVELPEGKVKIPSNMNIIATMNSADQGVHMLDTAFKRRWDYHFMSIDEGLNSEELKDIKVRYAGTDIDWKQFITILNEKLADDFQIPEDRLIGPFFVKPKIVKEDSEKAIKKILFYLWDDVLRNSSGRNQFFKGITTMSQLYKDFDKDEDVMGIKDKLGSNTENSGQA